MEIGHLFKTPVPALAYNQLEHARSELRILHRLGGGSSNTHQALLALETVLPTLEIEKDRPSPTWAERGEDASVHKFPNGEGPGAA